MDGGKNYLFNELRPAPCADLSIPSTEEVRVSGEEGEDRPLVRWRTGKEEGEGSRC